MKPNYVTWDKYDWSKSDDWYVSVSENSSQWVEVFVGNLENAKLILKAYIKVGCVFINKE